MTRSGIAVLIGLFSSAVAQPVFGQCDPANIGTGDMAGSARDVAVVGTTACVADGNGLRAFDVSNPADPVVYGPGVNTPDFASSVALSGTIAYVADRASGLQVVDVSNLAALTILGTVDTPGAAYGVAFSGTTAYLADASTGLQVIDVADPTKPAILGSVDTPGFARGVAISGTTAYVSDETMGLQVIDVSNPAAPTIIGTVDTPDEAFGVSIVGSLAYVADRSSGLQVIDVSNPATPVIIGAVDTPGDAYGVTVVGTLAYVADGLDGLHVTNVADPTNPTILGSVDMPSSAWGVAVSGTTAFMAAGKLEVIDVSSCFFAVRGACCINGVCVDLMTESDCLAVGGTYFGNGVSCYSVECDPVCAADTNNDGVVDVLDLLNVLGSWGVCP